MPLQVKLKGSSDFVPVQVVGKRRGWLRLQFEDGKSKWVELNTDNEIRGDDPTIKTAPKKTVSSNSNVAVETSSDSKSKQVTFNSVLLVQMSEISRKQNYCQQGAFFLNAYWREYSENKDEKESIWKICQQMQKLDIKKGQEGMALEEDASLKLLQDLDMAMTRKAFLQAMRSIDINNDRKMSLLEFLLFKFKLTVEDLMSRPQDGMTDELENALKMKIEVEEGYAKLEVERQALQEQASGTGTAAMKARIALEKFGKKEKEDLDHQLKTAKIKITKARKSPELREKGTEWFVERAGAHAKPKQAQSNSMLTDGNVAESGDKSGTVVEEWREELDEVIREYTYVQQAGFFLNAYWAEINQEAEALWEYCLQFAQLDVKNMDDGSYLNEAQTAKFLRANGEDRTAMGFRKLLAEHICLGRKNGKPDKKMSLLEFVLWKFDLEVNDCMIREQGGHSDTIRKGKKTNKRN